MRENEIGHLKLIEGENDRATRTGISIARLYRALFEYVNARNVELEAEEITDLNDQQLAETREMIDVVKGIKRQKDAYLRRGRIKIAM